ncbi:MAG: DUF1360 domain-containing protein [Terracidiphilus sp.]|jgi:hypothetical protein
MAMEPWFRLTLAVLATWRLTHLLAAEDGPWEIIANLRKVLGNSFLGKLMDCFYCLSLWVGAAVACLLANNWKEWPLYWLALSGAACLLERLTDRSADLRQFPPRED